MMDSQSTNFPNEGKVELEVTNVPEITPESMAEEANVEKTSAEIIKDSEEAVAGKNELETNAPVVTAESKESLPEATGELKAETEHSEKETAESDSAESNKRALSGILDKLASLVNSPEATKEEVDKLKQAFYKILRPEIDELKKKFIEEGGNEKSFNSPESAEEQKLKELLNVYKSKKATQSAEEEQLRAANYALKLQLIERMKQLCESNNDFNKLYNEFKEIQQRWKEAKAVPQEYANELWKNYQTYNERFYDLIKINHQLRDYDFRKNLETKTALCEAVEKLVDESDALRAFHKLQKLHQQWRETGPVTKDLREEIWGRFKAASAIINKRHQIYFEERKTKEQTSLDEKTALCEQVEAIDYSKLTTLKDWESQQYKIIEAQKQWRKLGPAPKKYNAKIFERFRNSIDTFFKNKTEFSSEIRKGQEKNLELKLALCERAEAMKDSTDWKDTTEKFIALQKEWKTIGSVGNKNSETVWKRFITACDYFFERKGEIATTQKGSEQNNLVAKKSVIEKIKEIDAQLGHDETLRILKEYMSEWNSLGHVPFKEKDKLNEEYRETVDAIYERLNIDKNDRRLESFRSNLGELGEKGKHKLYSERSNLVRSYERLKSELQTYENNMGFLTISTKGGDGLLKDMNNKIARLKDEMALMLKKIEAIDENL
ncbi:MAG: DUF349 domain-containing protein [Tannerellaceae bacterium]|jgi:hypothetical protein|nr:DUF349 domain-containing protein [Tannerellaceae bacterium]